MIRFIIYSIIAYLLLRFIRRVFRALPVSVAQNIDREANNQKKNPIGSNDYAPTVKCEVCGMYVAQNTALLTGERRYCSKSCAESDVFKG